ncbi:MULTISPECIES: hypothetical protein [Bacillus]|nr:MULTISPECIES: hypothetical protein [Bacillus]MBU8787279.1 hypothetical protein [Bacillus glycinifermentans]MDU0069477.1 hypothetical protein [Bacillus sp. IG6]MED8017543.1 hypothetical protein [Bacillus glycinifermentans]WKB78639.1 hypothetical protein QYM22_07305 [Bacillus glycinifermentans]SCA85165.1 hypothetical protein BGLY_1342 [Bacillus glycinifermentans]
MNIEHPMITEIRAYGYLKESVRKAYPKGPFWTSVFISGGPDGRRETG